MLNKKVVSGLLVGLGAIAGTLGSMAMTVGAQTTGTTTSTTQSSSDMIMKHRGHAPLGNDGVVSSVSGTTIVIAEESNEGGASYTVDASKATFTKNGAAATIADITVGSKIFVQGTVTGSSVVATSVSVGHPSFNGHGFGHVHGDSF